MVDYRPMWSDLGLALEPHDALLGVLSQAYQKIFLSQPSRQEGPYLEASDMVVGESTCDGKKKAYEVLSPMLKEFFLIGLPHVKSEAGKVLLKTEYRRFADRLEGK